MGIHAVKLTGLALDTKDIYVGIFISSSHSDIYGFSVSGRCDVLAVLFDHIKPSILAFPAKIAFDDKIAAFIDQNCNIVNGIISGIQANQ